MAYLEYVWAVALRRLLALRSIRRWIYGGIVVGGIVGLIVALAKGYWALILIGCGVGSVLGITLGLIIRAVSIIRARDQ